MSESSSFVDLMDRLRKGDEPAAKQIVERFTGRLIGLARTRFDSQFQPRLDAEDVVQSVYRTFFRRQAAGEFEVADWDNLWSLLTVITVCKCGKQREYLLAQRRNPNWEQKVGDTDEALARNNAGIDREPTPLEAAIFTETLEQVLRGFEGADRRVVELSFQGYNVQEIGVQVGRSQRTVRRLRERVKKRLHRMMDEESAA